MNFHVYGWEHEMKNLFRFFMDELNYKKQDFLCSFLK